MIFQKSNLTLFDLGIDREDDRKKPKFWILFCESAVLFTILKSAVCLRFLNQLFVYIYKTIFAVKFNPSIHKKMVE
jgi:hypothetical protein